MDKNTIIGILIIGAIIITFSIINKPSKEAVEEAQRKKDSLELVRQEEQLKEIVEKKESVTHQEIIAEKKEEKTDAALLEQRYGFFSDAATGENKFITLENDLLRLVVSTKGGRPYTVELKKYKTYDSLPLYIFDGDSTVFGFEFFSSNRDIYTGNLFFTPLTDSNIYIADNKDASVSLRLYAGDDKYLEYTYSLKPKSYMVDFDIKLVNMENIIDKSPYLDLTWQFYSPQQEKGAENENMYTTIGYKFSDNEVNELKSRGKDKDGKEINTKLKWIAFKQQFFSAIIIARNDFSNASFDFEKLGEQSRHLKLFTAKIGTQFNYSSNEEIPLQFYFGPNHYNTMRKYEQDFEALVPLGKNIIKAVNKFLIIPVFNFLNKYISNYGLIILLLTIFIKIIIFPLTYKSYTSSAKMKVLKPQVDEIGKKYPKPEDAMKKQQATMALYKKVGVSPFGGCLPMLIQFPVLVAMFRFFPASFELRQQSFLWADDLSSYDSILELPFTVPFGYGSHVSLFTLLMTISTIIYTKLNSQMTATANQQMPGMKFMMYFMPVMLLFWFNNYAAGLSYYYFLANIITFIQMAVIKRFIDEEEILRKLNENAKKAPTKSKFQQRLESLAKQRGVKLPK
ncbi:MAG: membrane protein insertase YidC [Bacteroidales bacterium]|nr:membrane protein insertase YidC [Bacteroidales bacterium]